MPILKSLSSTPQTDGTTVTTGNSGLSSLYIGSGNSFQFQSAAAMGRTAGYRMVQGGANQLSTYMDFDSPITDVFVFRRPLRFSVEPAVNTAFYRLYPDASHATNLGGMLLTTTRRINFVEAAGSGSLLNISSPSGTGALTAGADYILQGKYSFATKQLEIACYDYGSVVAKWVMSGTCGGALADAAGIGAVRDGINTSSSGIGNLDTCDGWAIGSGDYFPRYDVANSAPVANAGSDITVEAGATYVLTGSHSDVDGDGTITSRAWTLAGDTVSTSTTVTKTAPVTLTGTTLTYTYQVTDDQGATGTDTVVVTVLPASLRIKTAGIIRPGIRRTTS